MRSYEFILDTLNNTKLFEMAFDRKSAKRKFENLDLQLQSHLIKIVAFKDGRDYLHHCHEINHWLSMLNDVRWNRTQRLSKDNIMKILWEGPLGHGVTAVEDTLIGLNRIVGYTVPRNDLTYSQIYELLFKIYDEMCYDLSKGRVNNIQSYLIKNGYRVENP